MNKPIPKPDNDSILHEAWGRVVGCMTWLQAVLYGEFADHRPLSAVIADMLLSFMPGVVIVTSARDAVAIVLRLACHPEKREELMEWVLLCSCLIVIALPIAMAAGGALAAGAGAAVGGIVGSELAAALRAVMLLMIRKSSTLVELVLFLQKFIKGDVLKLLRTVKFVTYEKVLLQALNKIIGKLRGIAGSLRAHLEGFRYFDSVKVTIARLTEWEGRFYSLQQDALRQIPRALGELDARLAKVLTETSPKEAHTIASGVQVEKQALTEPQRYRVHDTPGKILAKVDNTTPEAAAPLHPNSEPKSLLKAKPSADSTAHARKNPDPIKPPEEGANTKKQVAADAAAAADRKKITELSDEARSAEKSGNKVLADAKIKQARDILEPYLPKNPDDSWAEVIKRLDVSSPKDLAVFWSGDNAAAKRFAESIGGVTLETTAGGRIIDNWPALDKYSWSVDNGAPPYARDLWAGVSSEYAKGAMGRINVVQTIYKLTDSRTLWHNVEKNILKTKMLSGDISSIKIHEITDQGKINILDSGVIKSLLNLKGTAPL
ncbi:hypothetical protein HD842_004526 [Massilia aurea]|uniref:Uncharacterized protein n=1 Tax=Massilia aurea TaxID=373040 RepID=A0A7X0CGL6_9BURK|nr:hypothetical protein [Massilia aurea]MBB6136348.1 hypothetical protein [Massilia aurea]